jgi:hypothetical protein
MIFQETPNSALGGESVRAVETAAPQVWPARPERFPELMRPVEAAQYLRLDELGTHTPRSALRTLRHWRDRGELRATKFARHVWYLRSQLDDFLKRKTEQ